MQFINPSTVGHVERQSDSDSDGGPPSERQEELPSIDDTHAHPRYPATPLHSHQEPPASSFWKSTLQVLCLAMVVSHVVMIWTLRTDVNRLEAYQKDLNSQFIHVFKMVQDMKQVEWRMVPAHS